MEQPANQNQPETTQTEVPVLPQIQDAIHEEEWFSKNFPIAMGAVAIGIVVGVLIGVYGAMGFQRHSSSIITALIYASLAVFAAMVTFLLLALIFKDVLVRLIFGLKASKAGDLIGKAQRTSNFFLKRYVGNILIQAQVPEDLRKWAECLLPYFTSWIFWGRFRNWWWRWLLGIFVSLTGLAGTFLLMNQNKLLENQNQLLESQNSLVRSQNRLAENQMYLSEASRRSALVVLMSNIIDKVDAEIAEQKKANPKRIEFNLSQSLIGQIAALSHSFKPYRYLEGDTLITKPLSPERGQLLITLAQLPLDTFTFRKIIRKFTFENAMLRSAVLNRAYLSGANLRGVDFTAADLSGADLRNADLSGADLIRADLSYANLSYANLSKKDLRDADLSKADLSKADLSGADLSWADLSGAKISYDQLKSVKSLFNCYTLDNSIKTALSQLHPHLFEEPKYDEE